MKNNYMAWISSWIFLLGGRILGAGTFIYHELNYKGVFY